MCFPPAGRPGARVEDVGAGVAALPVRERAVAGAARAVASDGRDW